jgi:diamine N-acetyltransferase
VPFTITKILPNQVQLLSTLAQQTFFETFTGTCTAADMDNFLLQTFNPQILLAELNNPTNFYFFINKSATNQPIGYLMYQTNIANNPYFANKNAVELQRIYIASKYHGTGAGQYLLNFFIQEAKNKAFKVAFLGVWEHNVKAQKFYIKNGFIDTGHRHNFPIGSTPQTDMWMERYL